MHVEGILSEEQHGFRPGGSIIDLISAVGQIIHKNWEFGKKVYMVFIDIRKDYDMVIRKYIKHSVEEFGVDQYIIGWMKELCTVNWCKVRTTAGRTRCLKFKRELKQGSVLFLILL